MMDIGYPSIKMNTQAKVLPKVLTFSEAKYYIFSAVFVGLAVGVPWFLHQFTLAGPKFLPMHFFVMFAGLLFGWRTGLLVGVLSPLMSYALTQMPASTILPQVVLELAVYGFAAGFLRERNLNVWAALISAMVLGRLARLALSFDVNFIQISWSGIVLQLISIPVIIYLLQKFVVKKRV